jgi:hypothetical protein
MNKEDKDFISTIFFIILLLCIAIYTQKGLDKAIIERHNQTYNQNK